MNGEQQRLELEGIDRRFAALRLSAPVELRRLRASVERAGIRGSASRVTSCGVGLTRLLIPTMRTQYPVGSVRKVEVLSVVGETPTANCPRCKALRQAMAARVRAGLPREKPQFGHKWWPMCSAECERADREYNRARLAAKGQPGLPTPTEDAALGYPIAGIPAHAMGRDHPREETIR